MIPVNVSGFTLNVHCNTKLYLRVYMWWGACCAEARGRQNVLFHPLPYCLDTGFLSELETLCLG